MMWTLLMVMGSSGLVLVGLPRLRTLPRFTSPYAQEVQSRIVGLALKWPQTGLEL